MDQDTERTNNKPTENDPVLYFHPDYLDTQHFSNLKVFRSEDFLACFSVEGSTAKSLPRSPFGGIYSFNNRKVAFDFVHHIEDELGQLGVNEIWINQPPHFYSSFISTEELQRAGYQPQIIETHQYIPITNELYGQLHLMEKRKLKNKQDFFIRKAKAEQAPEIHQFIAECRQENGLEINISLEKLQKLLKLFPGRYELFEARKADKLAAAAIMTLPAAGIAYYYLPATSEEFKSRSPMVGLMEHIYDFYRAKGISHLDLGISSINGSLQESLFKFKERMGANQTERVSFVKMI